MIARILSWRDRLPFAPFSISMNDGKTYPIPSRDHVFVLRSEVIVNHDQGDIWFLAARNMTNAAVSGAGDAAFEDSAPPQG